MHPLREYNGDKLVVAYDPGDGPLALQVAYSLARARRWRARRRRRHRRGGGHRHGRARGGSPRGRAAHPPVFFNGAKTQIDKASEIVGAMSAQVRGHLEEIAALVREGSVAPALAPPAVQRERPRPAAPPAHPTLL